jgi:hypothetical protein
LHGYVGGDVSIERLLIYFEAARKQSHNAQGWGLATTQLGNRGNFEIAREHQRKRRSGTRCVIATVTNYVRTKSDTKTKKRER